MSLTNIIPSKSIIDKSSLYLIKNHFKKNPNSNLKSLCEFLRSSFRIEITTDQDIVCSFSRDWSNISGKADMLARPINEIQCSILLYICNHYKILVTISAGKTNLTGSATPNGGLVISMVNMIKPTTSVNINEKNVTVAIGAVLEDVRNDILSQSNNRLYYPVDPTSRKDALIGGTISCNASGFVPGDKGATRFWVNGMDLLLPNGQKISVIRGKYISINSTFIIKSENDEITEIKIPNYKRPKIKNASGPYTADIDQIDFVDLIVGSEGCFGVITKAQLNLSEKPKNYIELFIPFDSEIDAINFYNYICKVHNIEEFSAFEYFGYNCQNYMKYNSYFFENKNSVGIYMQYPLFDNTIDSAIDKWYEVIKESEIKIDANKIILLNDKRNWEMFFEARHSMPTKALEKTKKLNAISMITDTIVPSYNFKEFLDYTHSLLSDNNIEYLLFGHLGDCHLHFHLIYDKSKMIIIDNIYRKIIKKSSELDGVYSAEHGTGKRKKNDLIECYGKQAAEQIKECKLGFDPNLILNIGNIVSYE